MNYYYISLLILLLLFVYNISTNNTTIEQLTNQLTYNKSLKDSFINYFTIIAGIFSYSNSKVSIKVFIIFFILQMLILLYSKQTMGVSLIWSGLLGHSFKDCKTSKQKAFKLLAITIFIYYAFAMPLTTIPHTIGTGVGYILF